MELPTTSDPLMIFTHIALIAVVGRLIFDPTLIADLFTLCYKLVPQDLDVLYGLQQAVSEGVTFICYQPS